MDRGNGRIVRAPGDLARRDWFVLSIVRDRPQLVLHTNADIELRAMDLQLRRRRVLLLDRPLASLASLARASAQPAKRRDLRLDPRPELLVELLEVLTLAIRRRSSRELLQLTG